MEFKLSEYYTPEYLRIIDNIIENIDRISKNNDKEICIVNGIISIKNIILKHGDRTYSLIIEFCKDSTIKLLCRMIGLDSPASISTIICDKDFDIKKLSVKIREYLDSASIDFAIYISNSNKMYISDYFTDNEIADIVYDLISKVKELKDKIDYDETIKIIKTIQKYEKFIDKYQNF